MQWNWDLTKGSWESNLKCDVIFYIPGLGNSTSYTNFDLDEAIVQQLLEACR